MGDEKPQSLFAKVKSMIETDKNVRLVAGDPTLSAELLLLFRMILADGTVREVEIDMLKRICAEEFDVTPNALDAIYKYLADMAYETSATQSAEMFKELSLERRQKLLDHMIAIAEADGELVASEVKLIERTATLLGFDLKSHGPIAD